MDSRLRDQLAAFLKGGQAFDSFEDIVKELKPDQIGVVPLGNERSAWQIVEHMRLSMRDILEYSQNENGSYEEKEWPEGYWTKSAAPEAPAGWQESIDGFLQDRDELIGLAKTGDLFRPFHWAPDHDLLREILVAAQHSAYHCGQLVLVSELVSRGGRQ